MCLLVMIGMVLAVCINVLLEVITESVQAVCVTLYDREDATVLELCLKGNTTSYWISNSGHKH